jgi:membrane-associated phospholipid phosphatase
MGFDWYSLIHWVDAHRIVAMPLGFAYASLIPQVIVLIVALGFGNHLKELRNFMLAAMICGTATVLLSPLFPALNQFAYRHIAPAAFPNLNVASGYTELRNFQALRSGTIGSLQLRDLQGIIAFPSYHAGLAAITLWGFMNSKIRWVGWPGAALALATILSTPIDGGHYLVDVIGGLCVGACSLAVAKKAIFWRFPALLRASPSRRSRAAFAP